MTLTYRDLNGEIHSLEVKRVTFIRTSNTALVVDEDEKAYEIDINRVLSIEE